MMYRGRSALLSFIIKPFLILFLVICAFGLVYLRSSFLKLEYSLGALEEQKVRQLKERKLLLAERTSLLSFAKLQTSRNDGEAFVMPDRLKVIYIDTQKGYLPYKASLEHRR